MGARPALAADPGPAFAGQDLAESVARVVAVEHGVPWLESEPKASCSGCLSLASCGSKSGGGASVARRFPLPPGSGLAVGDRVVVGLAHGSVVRAAGTAYGLPLLTMLGAGVAAQLAWADDGRSALATFCGLGVGLVLARLASLWLWRRGDLSPRLLRRLAAAPAAGEALSGSLCDEHR